MVQFQSIVRSNSQLSDIKDPLVALFVGATSGIGLETMKEFTKNAAHPRVYFVARSASAAAPIVEELRALNREAQVEVIEKSVSLIKEAEKVTEYVKSKESSLDLLCLSVGFFSLEGRKDTSEGLEASLTTRYYSRIRIAQLLLPLLNASKSPHVLSILAGGKEGPIKEDDLALNNPKNFSVGNANNHVSTMNTLAFERLASENPRISFVHAFPGLVATPLFGRLSSGFLGILLRYIVSPLVHLFARTATEAGQRAFFTITSARYSVDDGLVALGDGVQKAEKSKGGVFIVDENGETADNEKILEDFRARGVDTKIWDHTVEVFDVVSRS